MRKVARAIPRVGLTREVLISKLENRNMSQRHKMVVGVFISLFALGLVSCVSPVDEANKIARNGDPYSAYSTLRAPWRNHPTTLRLSRHRLSLGT